MAAFRKGAEGLFGDGGDERRRVELVEQVAAGLDETVPRSLVERVWIDIGLATIQDPDRRVWCRLAGETLTELGHPFSSIWAHSFLATAESIAGNFDAALQHGSVILEAGKMIDSSGTVLTGAMHLAAVAIARGDIPTLLELREILDRISPSARTRRFHQAADVHLRYERLDWTGQDDGTVEAFLAAVKTMPKIAVAWRYGAASAALITGEDTTAKRLWEQLRVEPVASQAWLVSRTIVPMARYRLIERWGTRQEAIEARASLEPLSGTWAGDPALSLGPVDLWVGKYDGLLGDPDSARRQFLQARQQATASGSPAWAARIDRALSHL